MSELKDLTGQRFGRLTVIARGENSPGQQARWICKCDCGGEKLVLGASLRRGETKSCGCISSEHTTERNYSHGKTKTRLYAVWAGMKERCNCKTHVSFYAYGGRGIKVCQEWQNSFPAFEKWAMENGYDASVKRGQCTLDRVDVNGNYEPSNCRWVSMKIQAHNTRRNCNGKEE